jgi:hypothetical protein
MDIILIFERAYSERCGEKGDVRYIDDAGHFIPDQGTTVGEFLTCCLSGTRSSTSPTA